MLLSIIYLLYIYTNYTQNKLNSSQIQVTGTKLSFIPKKCFCKQTNKWMHLVLQQSRQLIVGYVDFWKIIKAGYCHSHKRQVNDVTIIGSFIYQSYHNWYVTVNLRQSNSWHSSTGWAKKLHTVFIAITCLLSINFHNFWPIYTVENLQLDELGHLTQFM